MSTGALVADASARGVAVAALNVITLEHAEAIAAAAEACQRPVILQVSENAVRYHGDRLGPIAVATHAVAHGAAVPVAVHLDHVTDDRLLSEATAPRLRELFSSVMYDAGALPYAVNVERTTAATELAHLAGQWMEAELGYVGGKVDAPASAHAAGVRTDPAEAAAYVAATGVDALAVAVGSSHAMTARTASLDVDLVARLRSAVDVPLVLHGSSGVPPDQLAAAVHAGIAKVNIGTALNVAMTGAVRATLAADPDLVDPRRYLAPARRAMTEAVIDLLRALPS